MKRCKENVVDGINPYLEDVGVRLRGRFIKRTPTYLVKISCTRSRALNITEPENAILKCQNFPTIENFERFRGLERALPRLTVLEETPRIGQRHTSRSVTKVCGLEVDRHLIV